MENNIVKIIQDDYGEITNDDYWHLVSPINPQGKSTFCEDIFFGYGESNVIYEQKKGRITCPKCISMIKKIKEIRL